MWVLGSNNPIAAPVWSEVTCRLKSCVVVPSGLYWYPSVLGYCVISPPTAMLPFPVGTIFIVPLTLMIGLAGPGSNGSAAV
jgi:hypothetical protein